MELTRSDRLPRDVFMPGEISPTMSEFANLRILAAILRCARSTNSRWLLCDFWGASAHPD
ncbi:hypothetical protein EES39_39395 [Streptomyces sp. ADI92-24]|nr:hypothetical protein EES39_39395 [Streptomyces sp. ADI92-24]